MGSRLEPMKRVAQLIKARLDGVLSGIERGATGTRLEGIDSVVQRLKKCAGGHRNRDRFGTAIYFRPGGLDLSRFAHRTSWRARHRHPEPHSVKGAKLSRGRRRTEEA